jgi:nucleoside-diphosphate-sugar epimerase
VSTRHLEEPVSHHLVVGAGPIGTATAARLAAAGESVTLVSRSGRGAAPGITAVGADASSTARMSELAADAVAIYNCANPAYHRWPTDWPPISNALLSAAQTSGSVLATVSNLYGYGPVSGAMREDLPLAARGPKGRVRAQMFHDARAAHEAGRLRMTEVRGSDYVGPGAQSHLGERVVPALLAGKRVSVIGSPDQPHTWTYTHDVARMLVTAAADERAWGRAWHVPSNPPRTQREAIADLADVAGVPMVKVGTVPRLALRALGLVNPMMRELGETYYQFSEPFVMDSSDAETTFEIAPTPWSDVLEHTLRSYGWPESTSTVSG